MAGAAACGSNAPKQAPPQPAATEQTTAPETVKLDDDIRDVVGRPAPPWQIKQWINAPPLELPSLRGSVVLVRWFMSPDCPFCSATAPSLNRLHTLYKDRGLVVVGMYHHKGQEPLKPGDVESYVRHFGFQFPVAVDDDWKTLKRWWLDGRERRWTSVSFLLDRKGIIRRVHLGGRYALEDPDYEKVRGWVEELLAEPG
jgi:peroxiredoxin